VEDIMKKIYAIAAALSLGALATTANAADVDDNPSGPYVGLGWGQFNLEIDRLDDVGAAVDSVADSDDNIWKAYGGWRFNPYIAVELAYIDFGNPGDRFEGTGSDGNYRLDISGFAPYVIGTIPIGPVELFGKVGYYFYDIDARVDFDSPGPDIDSSASESDFLYGLGLGVTVLEHLNLRAEYEIVDIESAGNSHAFWLSANWRF
jgi:OOP family OmpA-OmpF porin